MASGKSLELKNIKRAEPVVVHEHAVADHTAKRYKLFGAVPNRAGRRGMGQKRRVITPRATLKSYEKS